jgi:hypothetical protein
LPSVYEWLARLLGTQPIHVSLAAEVFRFSCGDSRVHIRPLVWVAHAGPAGRIVAVGDEPPPAGGIAVDLISSQDPTISLALRQKALEAVLFVGFKKLGGTGSIQRPEIIFHNDNVLAPRFENKQREALRQAALAARAFGTRFE